MSGAHWHLILNHVPVVTLGLSLLILVVALLTKHRTLQQVSVSFIISGALLTVPVYLTGKPAEEQIEHFAGISEALIDRHEDAAEVALVAMGMLGVVDLSATVGFQRGAAIPTWGMAALLLLTMSVGGVMAWTANLGGQIGHAEIRAASTAAASTDISTFYRQERHGRSHLHDDDD